MCVGRYGISGKFVGINYALLPNREWNQKQKHKKQPWSNVECFAFGGATVRFASLETSSHATHQSLRHPLTRAHHIAPRIKTARRSRRKTPGDKMNSWKEVVSNFPTILHGRDAILRVRDKLLISNMILQLWADVKYHVPTGFVFSPKASGFYPFDDATALAGESGVGDVAWLIQASASNHKPKGRFFWFVVYVVCLKSDMPQH